MTFQEYLNSIGFFGSHSATEWKFIRGEYRKYYQKLYQQKYRIQFKRVEILFQPDEFKTVSKVARIYQEKPTRFIRKSCLAYINSEIYLPPINTLDEMKTLLRRSSNNINQLVKATHVQRNFPESRIISLVEEVRLMEKNLTEFYQYPKTIYKPLHHIPNAH